MKILRICNLLQSNYFRQIVYKKKAVIESEWGGWRWSNEEVIHPESSHRQTGYRRQLVTNLKWNEASKYWIDIGLLFRCTVFYGRNFVVFSLFICFFVCLFWFLGGGGSGKVKEARQLGFVLYKAGDRNDLFRFSRRSPCLIWYFCEPDKWTIMSLILCGCPMPLSLRKTKLGKWYLFLYSQ